MRILFALPGLHRFDRGAEVAIIAIASELAKSGDQVTLIGSGHARPEASYCFQNSPSIRRERFEHFPRVPVLRSETVYEEASFVPGLLARYRPQNFDITVTCSFPFTNWALRKRGVLNGRRPPHVFITQNGDWPALSNASEYRYFNCEGLVCTNPDYYNRNKEQWNCALIPNGVDLGRFGPGPPDRARFALPIDRQVILMVSALIETKRVADGIAAVARIPDAHFVVAGDGILRTQIDQIAENLLPNRFTRVIAEPHEMPILYRSADTFLHLSKEESFGNVFVEAMACGLPIVGHDTPRLRWIVGDDEMLVDTTESSRVSTALATALQEPASASAKQKRVIRAANFSWSIIAEKYRAFFEKIISREASSAY